MVGVRPGMTTATVEQTLAASPLIWALERVRLPSAPGPEPFWPYPYQAQLLADRSPRIIVLKARQTGVTTAAAIRMAHEAIFRPRSRSLVVSRDQVAAAHVLSIVYGIFDLLDEPPRLSKRNTFEVLLENGSSIRSEAATPKAGRGYTATSVTLDEAAFMEYDEAIYRAISPTLSRGGRLTVVSTPNGQANLFYGLWQGQEGGDWSRHRVHWRDCPAFDEAWYKEQRPRYTHQQWASEFELDFVGSGGGAFEPSDVEAMTEGWEGPQAPQEGHLYQHGWDIGRRRDATVGVTVDFTEPPFQVVAYQRLLRAPYAQIQATIDSRQALYGGWTLVESNSIGDPVIEALSCRGRVRPFVTSQKSKANALTKLVRAVEQGALKCGVPQMLSELKSYQWEDTNIVQDSVMALAICLSRPPRRGPIAC